MLLFKIKIGKKIANHVSYQNMQLVPKLNNKKTQVKVGKYLNNL